MLFLKDISTILENKIIFCKRNLEAAAITTAHNEENWWPSNKQREKVPDGKTELPVSEELIVTISATRSEA